MNSDGVDSSAATARYSAAVWTAAIAVAFSIVVCVVLAMNVRVILADDPMDSPELLELHQRVLKAPADAEARRLYRELDLELRGEYFRRLRLADDGAFLLLGGLVVFLAAGKYALTFRAKLPHPDPAGQEQPRQARGQLFGRCAVAGLCVLMAVAATVSWIVASPDRAPPRPLPVASGAADQTPATTVAVKIPTRAEIARNWPRFRGPGGLGISAFTDMPTEWNAKTGKNILWKTPVPLPGQNSPIVWGDRVFLTGATADKREVYCFSATDGKLLWRREIKLATSAKLPPLDVWEDGYSPPTAATDGQRVYAIFANGDLACLDYEGKVLWSKTLGPLTDSYGHSSSLMTHNGVLLVQLDQGSGDTPISKLLAYDVGTGKQLWAADREIDGSWMSPIVIPVGSGYRIIAGGNPYLIAHDPDGGDEIWRVEVHGSDPAPSPVFANGLIFVAQPSDTLTAIRADSDGKVAWQVDVGVPDIPSPLTDGKLLWTIDSMGMLTCFEAADGSVVYEEDLVTGFTASPSLAGGKVYLLNEEGVMLVIDAGRKYKLISRSGIGEAVKASPAFADGRIYIRGEKNLFCIGIGKKK